jgi:hypothetical protein
LAAALLLATASLSTVSRSEAAAVGDFADPRGTAVAKATPKPTPEPSGGRTLADYNIQKE